MSHDRDIAEEYPGADDEREADLLRLRRLWQSVLPPEPNDAAWQTILVHVHTSVDGPAGRGRSSRPVWGIVGLTAAAVILAALLTRSLWKTSIPAPAPTPAPGAEEPLPVAEADDVNILSMDARDVAGLVVGEPPVTGTLEFARPEDIRVIRCERCPHSGRFARLEPGEEVPMFVSAAAVEPADDGSRK